jgi:hypothetical protein
VLLLQPLPLLLLLLHSWARYLQLPHHSAACSPHCVCCRHVVCVHALTYRAVTLGQLGGGVDCPMQVRVCQSGRHVTAPCRCPAPVAST